MNEYVTIVIHILTDRLFLKKKFFILLVYHIQILIRVIRVSVSIMHKEQEELWTEMHEHIPTVFIKAFFFIVYIGR